jgi:CMP-N-acetylneuraminic acid synthetase
MKFKKTIAIVSERSSSKFLKNKNIKLFNNIPPIVWSIDSYLKFKQIFNIYTSTELII